MFFYCTTVENKSTEALPQHRRDAKCRPPRRQWLALARRTAFQTAIRNTPHHSTAPNAEFTFFSFDPRIKHALFSSTARRISFKVYFIQVRKGNACQASIRGPPRGTPRFAVGTARLLPACRGFLSQSQKETAAGNASALHPSATATRHGPQLRGVYFFQMSSRHVFVSHRLYLPATSEHEIRTEPFPSRAFTASAIPARTLAKKDVQDTHCTGEPSQKNKISTPCTAYLAFPTKASLRIMQLRKRKNPVNNGLTKTTRYFTRPSSTLATRGIENIGVHFKSSSSSRLLQPKLPAAKTHGGQCLRTDVGLLRAMTSVFFLCHHLATPRKEKQLRCGLVRCGLLGASLRVAGGD